MPSAPERAPRQQERPAGDQVAATPEETRDALLGGQTRRGPGIRTSFIQERGGERRAGPLAQFVSGQQLFALQLFLLLHSVASADPWDAGHPAGVWARALGKTGPGGEAAVSRAWAWLRERSLVRTERDKRILRVWKLAEDGSGAEYSKSSNYFTLPTEYFTQHWFSRLDLPATAVLLIALDRSRAGVWFELPTERTSVWFDISADSLQRGLDGLAHVGLLEIAPYRKKDPKARFGSTPVNQYRLGPPFETRRIAPKAEQP